MEEKGYGDNFNAELSSKEKVSIMENTFNDKDIKNTIKYPANYLASQFELIDGFDARWSSLISNNPLLFEDIDYVRIKQYINSQILDEEIEAYKSGKLRDMYATIENMLICNLKYYDRIMSFATMIFMHYVRINDFNYTDQLDKIPLELEMTPTRLWCCAMTGIQSTEWELNYAWGIRYFEKDKNGKNIVKIKPITVKPINGSNKSIFEVSFQKIYRNKVFARFIEYSALRCGTSGFQETYFNDVTSNEKLAQVCGKFTKTTSALGENQLQSIASYISEIEEVNDNLYRALKVCLMKMFNNDESKFNIWIFTTEFFIYTTKFCMKVYKDEYGTIKKDYLTNSFECFTAEAELYPSIKYQIEWAKYKIPAVYNYDMDILASLLNEMLQEKNYKNITCIKRMEDGTVSEVTFQGKWGNIKSFEKLYYGGNVIRINEKVYSRKNLSKFLINRGYFLIGTKEDINTNFPTKDITTKHITNHYNKYCIPIIQHMESSILVHQNSKNEIIDVVVNGCINPNKLNNVNIKNTEINDIDNRQLMSVALDKQQKRTNNFVKKHLFNVIYDYEQNK